MLVRHAMTRDLEAGGPGDSSREWLGRMRARRIRHVPVVEGRALLGIVSERDLLSALSHLVGEIGDGPDPALSEIMTREPLTCAPNEALDVVARRMVDARVGCLPVVSGAQLVGIVTVNDVLRGFTDHLAGEGTRRLQLMRSGDAQTVAPDALAICAQHGAQVTALLQSRTDTGAALLVLRLLAADDAFRALVDALGGAGFLLVGERAAA